MPTKLMLCGCKNDYMTKMYGEGMRVFNRTSQSEGKVWRCSSCKNEKSFGESEDSGKRKRK